MKRFITGLAALLILAPALAAAPAAQKMILEFVDGPDLSVVAADKSVLKLGVGIMEGDEVPIGATVQTGPSTTAELKLRPNGTIVKLAKATSFKIAGLASTAKEANTFALVTGKVRAVAAKGSNYQIASTTSICAVRGTDFAFSVEEGAKAELMVAEGLVQFDKLDAAGQVLGSIPVAAGQFADAMADLFEAAAYDAGQFAEQFGDMDFLKLLVSEVPKEAPPDEAAPAAAPEPQKDMSVADAAKALEPDKAAVESGLVKWLKESLGFEIGAVAMPDGLTYSKAVIQPNLKLGKTRIGLYLPVIYSANLFDPADWYRPLGNDEWSFGSDYFPGGDYLGGSLDFAKDLALKVKYIEYGNQLEDPFFLKVGNVNDFTLGHGLVMRNYANDTEFPSVRRLGFEIGVDSGATGFELVANDLTDPEIIGGRAFFRPGGKDGKLAFGASMVADIDPSSMSNPALGIGRMMLIGTGVDIDLPIITSEILGVRAFAEGAATLPWVLEPYTYMYEGTTPYSISAGPKFDLVYSDGRVKNWGAAAGLMGNALFIDWRLEYRYFTGAFRPSFFDSTYDRMRGTYAKDYSDYMSGAVDYADTPTVMGIYGEGGFKLLNDKLSFGFGYFWPWSLDATSISDLIVQSSDELHAVLTVKKGLIPIWDVSGSIRYDKRGLMQSLVDGDFKLLDENTSFGGELVMPVPKTPMLDLALIFQTVPYRDAGGNVKYDAQGDMELKPSVTIETRVHF
jgi:hypothetical protein